MNKIIADYILHEVTHSGDETDVSDASNIDYDEETIFINDDVVAEEDVDFYRKVNKKLLTGEDVANKRIGRLRIESEEDESSDDGSHDEKGIENYESQPKSEDDEITVPEKELNVYGTDLKEWNHHDKPKNSVCEFKGDEYYLKNFLATLYTPLICSSGLTKFLPTAKNFLGEQPSVKISNDPINHDLDHQKIKQDKESLS